MAQGEKIEVVVLRSEGPGKGAHEETFIVDWEPTLTVIGCLMAIQRNPVTRGGGRVAPVVWESNCLEEVCGACTMVINGKVRQACTALVDHLEKPIRLEPMGKFPLVRDLVVDRSRIFEDFKRVKAWIPIDGSYDLGPGPRVSNEVAQERYALARCMSCGCCLEVCPNYGPDKSFMGAATMNQVALMNSHPTGALNAHERLDEAMGPGGIAECGNAQACVYACPKEIPLTDSIASVGRQTTVHAVKKFLKMSDTKHVAAGPG
ncbi:MAG TPA: succinate dehydrogenase iron-sulfur subunit [Planctomycetota bacterium]|nr:succinate dehydrogenase iron-sulfur subunit [Planctomycetota bacterium]